MDPEHRGWLELVAFQVALVVVAAHFYEGIGQLVRQLQYGFHGDPFPALLVLSNAAVIAGIAYLALGGRRGPVYALGIALMLVHFVGYWAYHQIGHLPAMPWIEADSAHHGMTPLETLHLHLTTDTVALVSKVGELVLVGLLAVLLYDLWTGDGRDRGRTDPDPASAEADGPGRMRTGDPDDE